MLPVTGLCAFNRICPKNDFNTSGDATPGKFSLDLLNSNLLKVHEPRLVDVQYKPGSIVALKMKPNLSNTEKNRQSGQLPFIIKIC
jgi:hypothetical protein